MTKLKDKIINQIAKNGVKIAIPNRKSAIKQQEDLIMDLIKKCKNTEFGEKYKL